MVIVRNKTGEQVAALNDQEVMAEARFHDHLDMGLSCVEAAAAVEDEFPEVTDEFLDWLKN